MISETTSRKIDYWTEIETAAKNETGVPEHECKIDGGCQVEVDYLDSVKFWREQKSKENNETLNV
jgi:hypothetical protein